MKISVGTESLSSFFSIYLEIGFAAPDERSPGPGRGVGAGGWTPSRKTAQKMHLPKKEVGRDLPVPILLSEHQCLSGSD